MRPGRPLYVLRRQGYVHEYHRLIDDFKVERTVNHAAGNVENGGLGDDVFLAFLSQRHLDHGIEFGNIPRVRTVKVKELVEIVRMGLGDHEKRLGDAVPDYGEILFTDCFMLAAEKEQPGAELALLYWVLKKVFPILAFSHVNSPP